VRWYYDFESCVLPDENSLEISLSYKNMELFANIFIAL